MSAALAIRGVRDYLRQQHGWTSQSCGIQYQAYPPTHAGPFYIALDDAGVETGPEETHALKEILTLRVGVWRRPGGLPTDMLGNLQMPDDVYLANALTLADLERKVIVKRLGGLHQNYAVMNSVNAQFGLPNDNLGAEFRMPLVYRGRTAMESFVNPGDANPAFFGYKLTFKGLMRLQKNEGTIG